MSSKHRSSPRKRDIAQRCPLQQARKRSLTVYHHAIFECRSVATRRTQRLNTAGRVAPSTGCTLQKDGIGALLSRLFLLQSHQAHLVERDANSARVGA